MTLIKKAEQRDRYPVSLQQEGVYLQSMLDPDNAVWNTSHSWRYRGELNLDAFRDAVRELISRQASLRTNFRLDGDRIYQLVHENSSGDAFFKYVDLSDHTGDEAKTEARAKAIEEETAKKPYNLETDTLIRFLLIRLKKDDFVIVVSKHHIISDVTSRQILWRELSTLYKKYAFNHPNESEPLDIQYYDYAVWQQDFILSEYYQKQKEYWLKELSGPLPVLNLPLDSPRSENPKPLTHLMVLDPELAAGLREFCLRGRVPFSAVFLAGFYILLNKYGGQSDIVIGSLYRGRKVDKARLNKIAGLFVNNTAMRLRYEEPDISLRELLGLAARKIQEAYTHQDFLFEHLVRTLHPERSALHAPVFQAVFNMLNVTGRELELEGLEQGEWRAYESGNDISSQYDLSIYVTDELKKVTVRILSTEDRFSVSALNRAAEQYTHILAAILRDPAKKLPDLEIITVEEKQTLLFDLNRTAASYPEDKTIHQLFEEQAVRTPDAVALDSSNRSYKTHLTYNELNRASDRLASLLREKSVGPGSIAAVKMDRSLELLTAIFGILKAGAAYLPIDPGYPEERIDYILRDSNAGVLLKSEIRNPKSETNSNDQNPNDQNGLCATLVLNFEHLDFGFVSNFDIRFSNFAYVIYTSGSTGKPKGVLIEHRGLVNYIWWAAGFYIGKRNVREAVFPLYTSISFDLTVTSIFTPLVVGGRVVVYPGESSESLIHEVIEDNRVTVVKLTPTHLRLIRGKRIPPGSKINCFIVGGEELDVALAGDIRRDFNGKVDIFNEYGPTETVVGCMIYKFDPQNDNRLSVPIGRPVSNMRVYILDKNQNPLPTSIPGELYIAGTGVAPGYLNQPELTAGRFYRSDKTYKSYGTYTLYHTGDLARWLPGGNIEFLGRVDHQVKIRGFRIELGEIEAALNRHPGVKESVVTAVTPTAGGKTLCAYVVETGTRQWNPQELREYLDHRLPAYMLPSYFIKLEKLPLTPNGKTDRGALPMPGADGTVQTESLYRPPDPQNDVQLKLDAVWRDVLGLEKIGIDDSFFVIGGDSIKAIQVISRLRGYGYKLDIKILFKYFTIAAVSPYVETIVTEIGQDTVAGDTALAPIQQWFIEKNFTRTHNRNQSVFLYREEGFETGILKNVFQRLLFHHDLLRAVMAPDFRALHIKTPGEAAPYLDVIDLTKEVDPEERVKQETDRLQRSFDLFGGPLIKACLFRAQDGGHLFITVHHLIMDSASRRILFQDITAGYEQAAAGKEIAFPPKTHSFKHWAETLKAYGRSGKLLQEYDYWKEVCSGGIAPLFPNTAPNKEKGRGNLTDYYRCETALDEEESRLLRGEANRAYNTEINEILLSGLSLALSDCFGFKNTVIAVERDCREGIDVSRTVGWFTGLFPVLVETREEDGPGIHIRRTKELLRKIPNRGTGYGVLCYLAELPAEKRDALRVDPEICFDYLGSFNEDFNNNDPERPQSESVYTLRITCKVLNSKLTFTIQGDTRTFQPGQIETFAGSFKENLQGLITHCVSLEGTMYTPSDFRARELSFDELEALQHYFGRENISNIFHLSPMQEGMLFHHLYDPGNRAYIVQINYLLEGEVDTALFEKCCRQLVKRHEVFRTAFVYNRVKIPVQVVLKDRDTAYFYHDISHPTGTDEDGAEPIRRIAAADRERGFDLLNDALIRFTLIKTNRQYYWLLATFHHIIMDGWSTNLWLKDFLTLYRQGGVMPEDEYPHTPYSNYLEWLEDQDVNTAHNYWQGYLGAFEQVTSVRPSPPSTGTEYLRRDYTIDVPQETYDRLSGLAVLNGVTLNNVLQGVWGVVLHRWADSDDVLIGNVISGRNIQLEGIERITGLFINTIPMRIRLGDARRTTFPRMLEQIRDGLMESQEYGYLQLATIQGHAAVEGPLFDHIYVFENYPLYRELSSPEYAQKTGFKLTRKFSVERTNFDLNILVIPRQKLLIRFVYNENVYDHSSIARLAGHVQRVIDEVLTQPDRPVSEIETLTEEEKRQLLFEFNDTAADYPGDKTIHRMLEEQAARTPDAAAVNLFYRSDRTYSTYLTYKELNRRSARLAVLLRHKGVVTGSIVGLMIERSVELIVALYGILMAGAAYLPIDPVYPQERIDYMLKDSKAKILLKSEIQNPKSETNSNDQNSNDRNKSDTPLVLNFEHLDFEKGCPCQGLVSNFDIRISDLSSSNLAYVIYTSGSTGKPKGVLVEHRPLMNRLNWMQKKYPIGTDDTILHKTPFTFDVSVWELTWWAIVGARVCLLSPGGERDPRQIIDAVSKNRVTVMHFVPSMLNAFLDYIEESGGADAERLGSLKQVIASGEALTASTVKRFRRLIHEKNRTELANLYGPTEATIDVSYFDCPMDEDPPLIPIGKPIDNINLLILGKGDNLQPIGAAGELCIGGHGLARGYLNRPELTAERFFNWSNRSDRSNRSYFLFYRTGDLARWLPDGPAARGAHHIEYLGRIDHQVKIRGNRIELGEIEAALNKHPAVKESVVVAVNDTSGEAAGKILCAYLVPTGIEDIKNITVEQLREYLSKELPEYMIPSYFVQIEKIPLTSSGKVDRKSLPKPDHTIRSGATYEAPTDPVEEKLVAIWQDILRIDKIGIHDSFFSLGGHSLRVMNLAAQIRKTFRVEIPLRELFDKPTIAQIAGSIRAREDKMEKFERILLKIEAMSEEQAQTLVSQPRPGTP